MSNKSIHEKWAEDYDRKYISMDNRRKYEHPVQPYSIQTISVEPSDVILVHVSEDLDVDTINQIYNELQKSFPNNNILIANEYILKGLTIIKPQTGKVVVRQDITDDSLEKWLKKNVEFDI